MPGEPVTATFLKKKRTEKSCSTPAYTVLYQTALISTFWDMIRALEEAFQMPLIMDVILNYSLWIFFLAMPFYLPLTFCCMLE